MIITNDVDYGIGRMHDDYTELKKENDELLELLQQTQDTYEQAMQKMQTDHEARAKPLY